MFIKDILQKSIDVTIDTNTQDILELFSIYLSSNVNFKYNQTYLTDSLDDFFSKVEIFREKYLICNESIKLILKSVKSSEEIPNICLLFDNIFEYRIPGIGKLIIINNEDFCYHEIKKNNIVFICRTLSEPVQEYVFNVNCKDSTKHKVVEDINNKFATFILSLSKK